MAPQVSLIICTRNRAEQLRAALNYVRDLEAPLGGWELVIVDNGSTDSTQEVIHSFALSAPCPVVNVYEPNRGLSRARNTGIARAAGRLLAFTDDDCYVRRDYLVQLCSVFEDSGADYVGGRVVLHDASDAAVTIKDVLTPEVIEPRRFLEPGTIHGANMAVRREVVREIGGFDPLVGSGTPWICDDIEFLSRACWAGWSGRYDPRPVVAHHHGRKPGVDVVRLRAGYERGRGAYYLKGVLNPTSRITYLREWYWSVRAHIQVGKYSGIWQHFGGAATYLLRRLTSREKVPRF
jgi:glycosyltransferase involved in cell wall biosynthesis